MMKCNRQPWAYLLILVLVTIINALLARFAVIAWAIAPGASSLYFAVAFMIVFAFWFGAWGAVAAYLGCVLGAGLTGMPLAVNLYWSLADLWQVLIPLIALRKLNVDVSLRSKRDFLLFLIFGWLLNNLAGAAWGAATMALGGVIGWGSVPGTFAGWFIGNLMVTIVIAPVLLRYATPLVRKSGLLAAGYWR